MTLLIIDGDVLAYHSCPSRYPKVKELGPDGKPVKITFTPEQDRKYLEMCWNTFQRKLQNLLETFFASDYLLTVKGDGNFRDLVYPLEFVEGIDKPVSGYKANRWKPDGASNKVVPSLRRLAVMELDAVQASGREADDLIRIWATQAAEAGDPFVICTIDKDMYCIPGTHYHLGEKTTKEVSVAEARRHYYQQLLKGDPIDNIPGIPGMGNAFAAKALAGASTEEEFQEIVVEKYMAAYGDGWGDQLLSNGKLIHLQRHEHDYFCYRDWPVAKELYGV